MLLNDPSALFDISVRLQILTEGVKGEFAADFDYQLMTLDREISRLLNTVNYDTLDALSKTQVMGLVVSLRNAQNKFYSFYTNKLLNQLKAFMKAELVLSKQAYVSIEEQKEVTEEEADEFISKSKLVSLFGLAAITTNQNRLWSFIINAPNPATGSNLNDLLKRFSTSAKYSVESEIWKAWSNKTSVKDLTQSLLSSTRLDNGGVSQLRKIRSQADAVIDTATQHVKNMVDAGVLSSLNGHYTWLSVIDDGTTYICRTRNLQTYIFGFGPLPPGHYGCRSHIVGGRVTRNLTFFDWLKLQPKPIVSRVTGNEFAAAILNGEMDAKQFKNIDKNIKPLKLKELKESLSFLLS